MAFRDRKVFESSEKRTPGLRSDSARHFVTFTKSTIREIHNPSPSFKQNFMEERIR